MRGGNGWLILDNRAMLLINSKAEPGYQPLLRMGMKTVQGNLFHRPHALAASLALMRPRSPRAHHNGACRATTSISLVPFPDAARLSRHLSGESVVTASTSRRDVGVYRRAQRGLEVCPFSLSLPGASPFLATQLLKKSRSNCA